MVDGGGSRNFLPYCLYISGMKGGTLVVVFLSILVNRRDCFRIPVGGCVSAKICVPVWVWC